MEHLVTVMKRVTLTVTTSLTMSMTRRVARRLLVLAAVLFAAPSAVSSQVEARFSPAVEQNASRLFTEIMSPYCPGMTLTTCPSPQAAVMKDSIRRALAAGQTPSEIMTGLEASFGPEIRARPPARGAGLVAWIGPFALLGAGAIGLTLWLLRAERRRGEIAVVAPPIEMDEAMRAKLEAALREDG